MIQLVIRRNKRDGCFFTDVEFIEKEKDRGLTDVIYRFGPRARYSLA